MEGDVKCSGNSGSGRVRLVKKKKPSKFPEIPRMWICIYVFPNVSKDRDSFSQPNSLKLHLQPADSTITQEVSLNTYGKAYLINQPSLNNNYHGLSLGQQKGAHAI